MVHENLDVRETAYTIVNEGRRLIGCDRVSVAIKRGRTCKVEAVSGQDTIESRSNVVTALGHVATRVVATGESLWYDGATEDLPPQVEEALDAYVDESYAKNVIVLPLRKPSNPDDVARSGRNAQLIGEQHVEREILGALIVEQIETDIPREILEPRIDLVYEHSTRALANALDYHSVFLMPLWRTIGKSTLLVKGRNLPKTLTVGGIILAILLALFLIPVDFNLKAEGTLQPVTRQDVFFDTDGTIVELLVKGDQLVQAGQSLARLENHDLEQEYLKILGQMQETNEQLDSLQKQKKNSRNIREAELAQIAGEYVQLLERAKSLQEQKALVDSKREKLVLKSPIAGQVLLPWDAEQSLKHRPVVTGQKVMTIADPSQDWELELAMPERRMGHVTRAVDQFGPDLEVSYISAGDVRTTNYGTVKEINGTTQVKGEEGPTVKITVDIDPKDLFKPSPGTTVTAKLKCGRCSLGYSWFHEALEWVEKHILF
jgi:biotin carboxyl carrier protein